MFDDVMALQDADGYFSADAMEGLREMVAAGDAAVAAEEAKARSVAQREAAKAANRAAKVEARAQRAAANAAGRAAARAGRSANLPCREEPAPLVDKDAPMGGVFEPIANGTLVTVCAYQDAGVQRWENHAFVGRVFDYIAADDSYIVRGSLERERPRRVLAWRVQQRVLWSNDFDKTIASCAPATKTQLKRMANDEGRKRARGPVEKARASATRATAAATEAQKAEDRGEEAAGSGGKRRPRRTAAPQRVRAPQTSARSARRAARRGEGDGRGGGGAGCRARGGGGRRPSWTG